MSESFLDLVDQLTKPHPVTIERDSGVEIHTEDGLLQRLREAVFGGVGGSGGSQLGSKLPMDAAALDILELITDQAAQLLAQVDPRPTPYGHAEKYVALWAAAAREDQLFTVTVRETLPDDADPDVKKRVFTSSLQLTAFGFVCKWVGLVRQYFDPPSPAGIPNACPVPECGERYVYRYVDGQRIQQPALAFEKDRNTGATLQARCSACGATWPRDRFLHLAAVLGYPLPKELASIE